MSDVTLNPLECALDEAQALRGQVDALQAENAKLWELCKAWRKFARELFDEYIGEPEADDDFMEIDARMRELGIEVDGETMARLRSARTAPRVIVADGDTDCATGHCECGGCGGAIDCWDRFCKHCGACLVG